MHALTECNNTSWVAHESEGVSTGTDQASAGGLRVGRGQNQVLGGQNFENNKPASHTARASGGADGQAGPGLEPF